MTQKLREALQEEASAARVPPADLAPVLRAGGRAVRRRRIAGSAAAAAMVALAAAVVPTLASSPGDHPAAARSVDFAERQVAYALGSTIYLGGHEIDVSPYKLYSFVQTDDGIVFVARDLKAYFTDGDEVQQIGNRIRGFQELRVDDHGSYVGWVEASPHGPNETVVYDTSKRTEVLRTSEGNRDGCRQHPVDNSGGEPRIDVIDGDVMYVCNADGVAVWSLTTGQKLNNWPDKTIEGVEDAENGYVVESVPGRPYPVPVVRPANAGGGVRFPELLGADLSPNATYIAGPPTDSPGGEIVVLDRATKDDVTPRLPKGLELGPSWWLDDDRIALEASPMDPRADGPEKMLVCSISAGDCAVAASFHIPGPGLYSTPDH